ncbi:MAG: hypothetical protein KDC90_13335 [Ignavibacteriae bacterium]|nr:hypothetical protein [Ignavibacteriota bacterium]
MDIILLEPNVIRFDSNIKEIQKRIQPIGVVNSFIEPMVYPSENDNIPIILRLRANITRDRVEVFGCLFEFRAILITQNKIFESSLISRFLNDSIQKLKDYVKENAPIEISHFINELSLDEDILIKSFRDLI